MDASNLSKLLFPSSKNLTDFSRFPTQVSTREAWKCTHSGWSGRVRESRVFSEGACEKQFKSKKARGYIVRWWLFVRNCRNSLCCYFQANLPSLLECRSTSLFHLFAFSPFGFTGDSGNRLIRSFLFIPLPHLAWSHRVGRETSYKNVIAIFVRYIASTIIESKFCQETAREYR